MMFADFLSEERREDVSPEAAFQSAAIGVIHRTLFKKISWPKVKEMYFRDTGESHAVSWDWYSRYISWQRDFSFVCDRELWSMTLKDILRTPLHDSKLFKHWREQPSEGLIFPLVGKCAIMHLEYEPPRYSCVLFELDYRYFVVELLDDYVKREKEHSDITPFFEEMNNAEE